MRIGTQLFQVRYANANVLIANQFYNYRFLPFRSIVRISVKIDSLHRDRLFARVPL